MDIEKVLPVEQRTACPSHPCEILEGLFFDNEIKTTKGISDYLKINIRDAKHIIMCELYVNERYADKFASATNTTPRFWLNLQANYDKWMRCNG